MKAMKIKNNIIQIFQVILFLVITVSYGQDDDPRGEGQYMDYNTVNVPEFAAFTEAGNIEVNTATGVPVISIPLYTLELDGVQVPISLSYDASGIKVTQMETSVGLGWSLNAGGEISRTIRGNADEHQNYNWFDDGFLTDEYYSNKDQNSTSWQKAMKGNIIIDGLAKLTDHNPDLFSYSFPGYSGTYIHQTNRNIIKEKEDGIILQPLSIGDSEITVNDLEGNSFIFDKSDAEYSFNKSYFATDYNLDEDFYEIERDGIEEYPNTWKLSQIQTKNNKTINFEYTSTHIEYEVEELNSRITVGNKCDHSGEGSAKIETIGRTKIFYDYKVLLIEKISSEDLNYEVLFHYEPDTDPNLPDAVWKHKLARIDIRDKDSGVKKSFIFSYSRFPGEPRLRLDGVQELGYDAFNNVYAKPPYSFQYYPGALPSKSSKGQDLYGYYNGKDNNTSLVPTVDVAYSQGFFNARSGNRTLNASTLKRGVLSKMIYPTGGFTTFEYEPNVENVVVNTGYRGGLRVYRTKDVSELGEYSITEYQYSGITGISLDNNVHDYFRKSEGNSITYYSDPIRMPGDQGGYKTDFFYNQVTILKKKENTIEYKEIHEYQENPYNYQRYDPVIKSITSFYGNSGNKVKSIEYKYPITPSGFTSYEWNVLGDMDCYYPHGFTSQIGYTTTPRKVRFSGNYAYLPTTIITTDYVSGNHPITVVKDITYDPETLLKKEEITDFTKKRLENGQLVTNDVKAEKIRVEYTYPFDVTNVPSGWPLSTVIKQEVFTTKDQVTAQTGGKAFVFDDSGNIKTIYEYAKGMGSNTSSLDYVPSHYEERTSFIFDNGFPVQVRPYAGAPTSYIWNLKGNVPVAKIEGRKIGSINEGFITELENASYTDLDQKLETFRSSLLNQNIPFLLTTYAYTPLHGVSVITDSKDDKTTFEYDAFGRLKFVRDSEGNILSENEYKYALDLP